MDKTVDVAQHPPRALQHDDDAYPIFLSYTPSDVVTMLRVTGRLEQLGYRVWVHEASTNNWRADDQNALDGAACVVVIASLAATHATWLWALVSSANEQAITVMLVLAEGQARTTIPAPYRSLPVYDLSTHDANLPALEAAIAAQLGLPTPAPISTAPATTLRVFISYASQDRAFADAIKGYLTPHAVDVFIDYEGLRGGQDFSTQLRQELDSSDALVLVVTPESAASRWVGNEVYYAYDTNKPIIPVVVRHAPDFDKQFWYIKRIQRLDYYHAHFADKLCESLGVGR